LSLKEEYVPVFILHGEMDEEEKDDDDDDVCKCVVYSHLSIQ